MQFVYALKKAQECALVTGKDWWIARLADNETSWYIFRDDLRPQASEVKELIRVGK